MSSNKKMTTIAVICAVFLIAAAAFAIGSICNVMGATYENAESYTKGAADISENVKNLDIHWISGRINVAYHKENTVLLEESANKSVSADMEMRWWLDGDTLRVQYSKSGAHFFNFSFTNLQKTLTVTLPESISLKDVAINATSADMEIPSLRAEAVRLNATSGNINASADAPAIDVEATSGDVAMKTGENADELSVVTTSGKITLEAGNAGRAKVGSTSGDLNITGGTMKSIEAGATSGQIRLALKGSDDVQIDTTSGDIKVELGALKSLKVKATSGDVTALLPETPGFTADLHTTSGDVHNALKMSSDGSTYVCGDGSGTVEIHTTSGEVTIDRAAQ